MKNVEVPNYLVNTKIVKMKQCYNQFVDLGRGYFTTAGKLGEKLTKINTVPELKAKGEVTVKSHYL